MWSAEAVIAVIGMAVITYSLRVGGLLAADWLPSEGSRTAPVTCWRRWSSVSR